MAPLPDVNRRPQGLTRRELLALPAVVDLTTAARAYGFGRTKANELLRAGGFPVPVMRIGGQYRVRTADLLRELGIVADGTETAA